MARGLMILSPHSKTTSQMLLASIARAGSLTNFPKHSHPDFSLQLQYRFPPSGRFVCCCSNQHGPINMSNHREAFAGRMAMAGLKPHHRLALGVSGGPDSIALCILASLWKREGQNIAAGESSGFIDGLLAIVVDHGLRPESKNEANLVCSRVSNMGIRCEVIECVWSDGRPKQGHLQEAARDKRYELLQNVCVQHQFGVLLIAHHADDQEELFILRLSRSSGVLGLAGMAFTSQLFPKYPDCSNEALSGHGILLVRPLLEFSKEDMYRICRRGNQEWVEDPTNKSSLFARNRIRMSLNSLSSSIFKAELQAVISACRRTRLYVEKVCSNLLNQAVTIMPQGYAVIDLKILNPSDVDDICLSKFITLVLQFISQRHRPVRGSASKLLLDYIRTFPSKTCLTAAGCYLCPAPGSKGSKVLICCSVDYYLPTNVEVIQEQSTEGHNGSISAEVEQIVEDGKCFLDESISSVSDIQFLGVTTSESVLLEAKRLGILSESTYRTIISLQEDESENFKYRTQIKFKCDVKDEIQPVNMSISRAIYPGQVGYFMSRFLVEWNLGKKIPCKLSSVNEADCDKGLGMERQQSCCSCVIDHDTVAEVRRMVYADWLYLAELANCQNVQHSPEQVLSATETEKESLKVDSCADFFKLSAKTALQSLKSIPVGARRGLPVLVNSQGQLLSIPSVCFKHCPCVTVSTVFKPRVPLGGGHNSFI